MLSIEIIITILVKKFLFQLWNLRVHKALMYSEGLYLLPKKQVGGVHYYYTIKTKTRKDSPIPLYSLL